MSKLQKMAKNINSFLKVSYWANIIASVILGILVIWLWRIYVTAPEISDVSGIALDFGMIRFTIDPEIAHHKHAFINRMMASSTIPFAQTIIWCMIIRCGQKILAPMMENQPFHEQMGSQLYRMGWLNIGLGIVDILGEYFLYGNLIAGYDLDAIFLNDMIVSFETQTEWDLAFLLWSAVLFLLSYVFKHGWELQQLSDETL